MNRANFRDPSGPGGGQSIHIRLKPQTAQLFTERAKSMSMSLSSVLRMFIEEMLVKHKEFSFGYKEEINQKGRKSKTSAPKGSAP